METATQAATLAAPPTGYFQNVHADGPCFQKFEMRTAGRKFSVFELTWYPNGAHYDHLWSFHFSLDEAQAEMTRKECSRDGRPLPPGRYQMFYYNGKQANGLAKSSAEIHAKKTRKSDLHEELVTEVVPDKYNPGKYAVVRVLVVEPGTIGPVL